MLFRNASGSLTRSSLVISALLILLFQSFPLLRSLAAQDLEPQVLRTFNVGSTANTQIVGAAVNDHLSGNGTAGDFASLSRAHAIVTGDFDGDALQDIAIGAPDTD